MNPGRELDALVAEKVMGWTGIENDNLDGTDWYAGSPPGSEGHAEVPAFSTDISAAWEVVEEVNRKNVYGFRLHNPGNGVWEASWNVLAEGMSAPLAICLAALKAVGVEVSE